MKWIRDNHPYILMLTIIFVLVLSVWNSLSNHGTVNGHQEFFTEVRAFMEAKGNTNRFTAEDGKALEERIEALEKGW